MVVAYVLVVVALGWWTTRRVRTGGDYFMAGRRGNKIAMIANALGAGTHTDQAIAVAGAAYQLGLAGIWYQWVYLFVTPFFWILAPVYRRLRYVTTADFYEERFGSKLSNAYVAMALLYFAMDLGLILKGTALAISAITGGQIPTETVIMFIVIFFLTYSVLGGLTSALSLNLLQGVFILVLSFLLIPFALARGGGIAVIREKLPEFMFSFVAPHEVTLFFIVMIVINGLVGIVAQPHHMAIAGSGKTENSCRMGWTYGTFTKRIATLGWAFVGVFAAALFPGLTDKSRELAFGIAVKNLLPVGLVGLMVAAMTAAVLPVCHNYMVSGSALFTRNIFRKYFRSTVSNREELRIARSASVVIILAGVVIALTIPSIVKGLILQMFLTSYFGISFYMGIMWRRANRYGVWASVGAAFITNLLVGPYLPFGLHLGVPYQIALFLPAGFAALIAVSIMTKPEPDDKLDAVYALLHTPVGEEDRLKVKGIEMKYEGDSRPDEEVSDVALEDRGHSLLLVDFLSLGKKFSFKRYRIDLEGFGLALLFVLGIFAVGLITASIR